MQSGSNADYKEFYTFWSLLGEINKLKEMNFLCNDTKMWKECISTCLLAFIMRLIKM